jgi:hypothetical protein
MVTELVSLEDQIAELKARGMVMKKACKIIDETCEACQ